MHPSVSVHHTDRGRTLVTDSDIPAGTVILSDEPAIWAIYEDFRKEVCFQCWHYQCGTTLPQKLGSSRACETCTAAGSGNQEWDWFVQNKKAGNQDLHRFCASGVSLFLTNPGLFEDVKFLQDDTASITELEKSQIPMTVTALSHVFPALSKMEISEIVYTILGRSRCNCFGIWELHPSTGVSFPDSEMFGYAVYPRSSLFNHSCTPNVEKRRRGRKMEFITKRDVRRGEELLIDYLGDREYDSQSRRSTIKEYWGFECDCPTCTSSQNTTTNPPPPVREA